MLEVFAGRYLSNNARLTTARLDAFALIFAFFVRCTFAIG